MTENCVYSHGLTFFKLGCIHYNTVGLASKEYSYCYVSLLRLQLQQLKKNK